MTRLESGPAKADTLWQLGRTILFLGFAAYFCYDGSWGYPHKNQVAAEAALQSRPFDGKLQFETLGETPTKEQFAAVLKTRPSPEQVRQSLGPATFSADGDDYYVTRYGYGRFSSQGSGWQKWPNGGKDKEEIQQQFYFALIPLPIGLYFLYRLIKAATLRVVLDDEGLTYGGRRIACADMVSLRDYSPKGWIDLYYRSGEKEKRLRLDNEKVKLFDEIVAAICEAKGFKNEVQEHAARKADAEKSEPSAG
jgi:hypothetical protein